MKKKQLIIKKDKVGMFVVIGGKKIYIPENLTQKQLKAFIKKALKKKQPLSLPKQPRAKKQPLSLPKPPKIPKQPRAKKQPLSLLDKEREFIQKSRLKEDAFRRNNEVKYEERLKEFERNSSPEGIASDKDKQNFRKTLSDEKNTIKSAQSKDIDLIQNAVLLLLLKDNEFDTNFKLPQVKQVKHLNELNARLTNRQEKYNTEITKINTERGLQKLRDDNDNDKDIDISKVKDNTKKSKKELNDRYEKIPKKKVIIADIELRRAFTIDRKNLKDLGKSKKRKIEEEIEEARKLGVSLNKKPFENLSDEMKIERLKDINNIREKLKNSEIFKIKDNKNEKFKTVNNRIDEFGKEYDKIVKFFDDNREKENNELDDLEISQIAEINKEHEHISNRIDGFESVDEPKEKDYEPPDDNEPSTGNGGKSRSESDGLSNTEIDKIMGVYPEYIKCIPHDQVESKILPNLSNGRHCFVINTDPANKPGEHWQCVYMDKKEINFYDSFGDEIDDKLMNDIRMLDKKFPGDGYRKFKFNTIQHQDDRSDNCGHFCCKFLIDRLRGKSFKVASGYDQSVKGEKDISEFKKQQGFGYIMDDDLVGKGIIHKIGRFLHLSGRMPLSVKRVLKKKGDMNIRKIVAYRHPIQNGIKFVLNLGSLGKIKKKVDELGYDDLYHLRAIMQLEDGSLYTFEKTSVAVLKPVSSFSNDNSVDVNVSGNLSLSSAWKKAENRMGEEKFYSYNAVDNNCQDWLDNFFRANGMMNPELDKFINQNVVRIMKDQGLLAKIAEVATDIGAIGESTIDKAKESLEQLKETESSPLDIVEGLKDISDDN